MNTCRDCGVDELKQCAKNAKEQNDDLSLYNTAILDQNNTLSNKNEQLLEALKLALPLLKDDVVDEGTLMCSYCGGTDSEDSGSHKSDCVQLVAYLAVCIALEVTK